VNVMLVGLAAAFAMAFVASLAPTGPIAALVLSRSVRGHHAGALALGVGGAAAEAGWSAIAVLGVGAVVDRIPGAEAIARAIGLVVLLAVGVWMLRFRHDPTAAQAKERRDARALGRSALSGFAVSAANPVLLFTWGSAVLLLHSVAGIDLGPTGRWLFPLAVALGIIAAVATSVALVRRYSARFTTRVATVTVRVAGGLMIVLGVLGAVLAWPELAAERPALRPNSMVR
jgi:threonine/homoserine/homoserine lactone efflux protein